MPDLIQALWIGSRLSAMERLAIASFLRHGHEFHLYAYEPVQGVPPGTALRDANEILPASAIFQYREFATYAGFANFFRYKLLLEKGGWFVDADTVCLRPFDFAAEYVFSSQGEGEARQVNVAAVKVPRDSDIMRKAWNTCCNLDVATLKWGQSGPSLVTRLVAECGLEQHVQPPEAFCPVPYLEWEKVLDPAFRLIGGADRYAIHLWNEMWRRAGKDKDRHWDPNCLYEELQRRYLGAPPRDPHFGERLWRHFFRRNGGPCKAVRPLKGLRIAATIPPRRWFGGVDYEFALDMQRELVELGAQVLPLPIDPFVDRNPEQIHEAVQTLRSFRPALAISLANAGHVLACAMPDGRNVFRDLLEIPTVMLWDHGPLQFSQVVLGDLPAAPSDAVGGCLARMRQALDHPLFVHYSPDRGHIAALDRLGVLDARNVEFFLQPAYPCYVRQGFESSAHPVRKQVVFAGNVYVEGSQQLPFRAHPILNGIWQRVFAARRECLTASLWDLVMAEIASLSHSDREELRLDPDSSFFWRFVHGLIEVAGNTEARLEVLTRLRHELQFYGNFMEPDAQSILRDRYRIQCRASLHCVNDLPLLFASSALTVDVINLGYNTGSSPKVTACLAAGGLPLFDYKPDFHEAMGDAGDAVMYRSVEHLNALIDEYLTNWRRRQEVVRELQERVRNEFTFAALSRKILSEQPLWSRVRSSSAFRP